MKLYNSSKNILISDNLRIADNFFTRSVGLISSKSMADNEALIIKPCCSVHTFFMKFNIDVIFVDKNYKVIEIFKDVAPNKILPIYLRSLIVIEMKAFASEDKIFKGDILSIVE